MRFRMLELVFLFLFYDVQLYMSDYLAYIFVT